ncbi:hypothetical protein OCU04_010530 [Sclerotinia nivalis]|uniref:Uncharacterized protein n=1 Tax=Sclerotinia nivalis TaxID=352851 RepID=A0A9X0DET8_9HELO|nr:hypothetical protein OCU04_010530 [Sclerotinia nivalis]
MIMFFQMVIPVLYSVPTGSRFPFLLIAILPRLDIDNGTTDWEHKQSLPVYKIRANESNFSLVLSKNAYSLSSRKWSPDESQMDVNRHFIIVELLLESYIRGGARS